MTLQIENVSKVYGMRTGAKDPFYALRDVNLVVRQGESFGLVGESGSGKTTLTRCILGLDKVSAGKIVYNGIDLTSLSPREMRAKRAEIQIVFQDPYASLNPRMTIYRLISEAMFIHKARLGFTRREIDDRVYDLLELVGLNATHAFRFPHEFSGGQRQRIGIARALAVGPKLLILDEPTSALDVSVQAQVLNLLHRLQQELGLTYLFISHDLGVIRYVCDRVALIHRGQIVETGLVEEIFNAPSQDYSRLLISSMPIPDPDLSPLRKKTEKI
jgi:ABC-type oligopeptide transport system ATPase subunit